MNYGTRVELEEQKRVHSVTSLQLHFTSHHFYTLHFTSIKSCLCRVSRRRALALPPHTAHAPWRAPSHAPPLEIRRLPTSGVLDLRCMLQCQRCSKQPCLAVHMPSRALLLTSLQTVCFFSLAPDSIPAIHRNQRHRRISLISIATRVLEGKRRRVDFDRGCLP